MLWKTTKYMWMLIFLNPSFQAWEKVFFLSLTPQLDKHQDWEVIQETIQVKHLQWDLLWRRIYSAQTSYLNMKVFTFGTDENIRFFKSLLTSVMI